MASASNSILQKNEQEANIFVAKVMRITAAILTLILVLNIVGIFIIKMSAMVTAYILGLILLLIPTLLVNVFKINHSGLKYLFVTIAMLFVCIMIVTLNWHAVVIFIFAIGVACMYFSKAVNLYAMITSPILFSASQYLAYTLNLTDDKNMIDVKNVVIFCILPRALSLVAMSVLFLSINTRTRNLLANLMDAEAQTRMINQVKKSQQKSHEVSQTLMSTVNNTSANNKKVIEIGANATKASEDTLFHLQDVSDNITKISQNLADLSCDTDEITNISNNVHTITKDNLNNMSLVMKEFDEISNSTDESRKAIKVLEEKSREIENITKVITDISSQTNLLALNASIESAHAGDAGKGFAVVAEEIRALANQTNKAVGEIGNVIEDVINNTMNAAKSMSKSSELVTSGMSLVKKAGLSSSQVDKSTDEMNIKIENINMLTKDVATYSQRIIEIVNNVNEISSNSMNELKMVNVASEEEKNNVEILKELVKDLNDISEQLEAML